MNTFAWIIIIIAVVSFFVWLSSWITRRCFKDKQVILLSWMEKRIREDVSEFMRYGGNSFVKDGSRLKNFRENVDECFHLFPKIYEDLSKMYKNHFNITDDLEVRERVVNSLKFFGLDKKISEFIPEILAKGHTVEDYMYFFTHYDKYRERITPVLNTKVVNEIRLLRERVNSNIVK